jgi:bifunctional N-acetylglucosamine-1-phosphate-uridyltransferase/glucosamine-1-phosphate-acetyltransferase GlmU-like protein
MTEQGCEVRPEIIIKWMRANLLNPMFCVWIAQEGEEVVGYCVANIQQTLDREVLNIVHLDGDTPEIETEVLTTTEKWAKEYALKYGGILTKNPDRFIKYGYTVNEYKMTKEL